MLLEAAGGAVLGLELLHLRGQLGGQVLEMGLQREPVGEGLQLDRAGNDPRELTLDPGDVRSARASGQDLAGPDLLVTAQEEVGARGQPVLRMVKGLGLLRPREQLDGGEIARRNGALALLRLQDEVVLRGDEGPRDLPVSEAEAHLLAHAPCDRLAGCVEEGHELPGRPDDVRDVPQVVGHPRILEEWFSGLDDLVRSALAQSPLGGVRELPRRHPRPDLRRDGGRRLRARRRPLDRRLRRLGQRRRRRPVAPGELAGRHGLPAPVELALQIRHAAGEATLRLGMLLEIALVGGLGLEQELEGGSESLPPLGAAQVARGRLHVSLRLVEERVGLAEPPAARTLGEVWRRGDLGQGRRGLVIRGEVLPGWLLGRSRPLRLG
ncbi:MAG: hypothetical protein ACYTDY_16265, partial [Planctomycetota bacterium]